MATTNGLAGRMPRKARSILTNLLKEKQITPEGNCFLIAACDPFHDEPIDGLKGYPDMTACRSNVQVVTQTTSITSPFDDGITPWDMHVPFMPLTPCFTQDYTVNGKKVPSKDEEEVINMKIEGSVDNIIYKKNLRTMEKGRRDVVFTRTALMHVPDDAEDYFFKADEEHSKLTMEYIRLDPKDPRITLSKPDPTDKGKTNEFDRGFRNRRKGKVHNSPDTVVETNYFRSTVSAAGDLSQSGSGLQVAGGWNVFCVGVGEDWQTASDGTDNDEVAIDPTYTSGAWRLISTGCEVVNTTAELYKGGSVTVFRSPSIAPACSVNITDVATLPCRSIGLLPPSTQNEAALYPDSKTWGAEEGSYQVATLNTKDNPYYTPVPGVAGMISPSSYTDLENATGWLGYFPFNGDGDPVRGFTSSLASGLPYDCVGSVYSGLNPNTTMQVTTRYYFERHPTIADPDLLTLSQPSAPYDPLILEILSRVTRELPVGVMVKENPMGEWFNDVLEFVGEWGPKIGKALGNVGVPMASMIGGGLGGLANSRLKARQKTNNQNALVASSAAEKKVKPRASELSMVAKQGVGGRQIKAPWVPHGVPTAKSAKNKKRKLKKQLKKLSA